MYICEDCGNVVEEIPTLSYYDRVDGNWAMSGEITIDGSCECGGNFVKAIECPICGEWINPEQGKICKECLEEEMTLDNAIEYSKECGRGYTIELPDFFEIYDVKEIEEILKKHILSTEHKEQRSVEEYCKEDSYSFSEFIENKYN